MKKLLLSLFILTSLFCKAQDNICLSPDASKLSVHNVSGLDEITVAGTDALYIIYLKDDAGNLTAYGTQTVSAPYPTMWVNPAILPIGTYTVQYATVCHQTYLGFVWSQPSSPVTFTNPLTTTQTNKLKGKGRNK